ncbi:unnamed protein product [Agarophyton chilense]
MARSTASASRSNLLGPSDHSCRVPSSSSLVPISVVTELHPRGASGLGFFVPYQNTEINRISPFYEFGRYAPLPGWWSSVEVCRGCYVELPPVVSYLGSYFIEDPHSGLWSVVLTEWAVRAAAYILWEAYDQYRLWYLPPRLRGYIRQLDLQLPLGGVNNADEAQELIDIIGRVNWAVVPARQSGRGQEAGRADRSPGRRTPLAGDFIFFNS